MQKSQEIRDEISTLINDLAELDYREADKAIMTPKLIPLPSEEDYLGFTKFSSPNILLPHKSTETQRFIDREFNRAETSGSQSWIVAENKKIEILENRCQCLREFYDQHSNCAWTNHSHSFYFKNLNKCHPQVSSNVLEVQRTSA